MGPIADLYNVGKRKFLTLQGLELRPLSCPARSQSLYRLSYSGSCICMASAEKKKIRKLFDHSLFFILFETALRNTEICNTSHRFGGRIASMQLLVNVTPNATQPLVRRLPCRADGSKHRVIFGFLLYRFPSFS
jgi:hypothetical protein